MLIAVDIGNSRVKFALYDQGEVRDLATFADAVKVCGRNETRWAIGSVNPRQTEKLLAKLAKKRPDDPIRVLKTEDVSITIDVDEPRRVGIDRLLAACAAVKWKRKYAPDYAVEPILLVDLGTAITVDLVSGDGVFLGGAILPGLELAAKSLRRGTALLPKIRNFDDAKFPGKNTVDAIRCGLFEGTVGTIRRFCELVEHSFSTGILRAKPLLLLTGGNAEPVYNAVRKEREAIWLPRLVLDGIHATSFSLFSDFS